MTNMAIDGAGEEAAGDSQLSTPKPARGANGWQFLQDYISEQQCAEALGISRRTLSRWHRLREGPPRTYVGKRIRYRRSSVESWLAEQEREVGE